MTNEQKKLIEKTLEYLEMMKTELQKGEIMDAAESAYLIDSYMKDLVESVKESRR